MTTECRFNEIEHHGFCVVHQQRLTLCLTAAQALQQEVTRLVGANEHWHARVEQLKLETEALHRQVDDLAAFADHQGKEALRYESRLTSLQRQVQEFFQEKGEHYLDVDETLATLRLVLGEGGEGETNA